MSRLITVENINFQINSVWPALIILTYFFFFFWSSKFHATTRRKKKCVRLNKSGKQVFVLINDQKYARSFTRTKYHRVAKWSSIVRTIPARGPTSPYASLDALFRASKMHVRVYPRCNTADCDCGKLVAFHNTGFNGPFWAPPRGCRAKRNWFSRRLLDEEARISTMPHERLAFPGKFAR